MYNISSLECMNIADLKQIANILRIEDFQKMEKNEITYAI